MKLFFWNKNPLKEEEQHEERNSLDYSSNDDLNEITSSNSELMNTNWKKWSFYSAMQDKPISELMQSVQTQITDGGKVQMALISEKTERIKEQLAEIESKIRQRECSFFVPTSDNRLTEETNHSSIDSIVLNVLEIKEEFLTKKATIEDEISELEVEFKQILQKLGEAHQSSVSKRIEEVHKELELITTMYNDIYSDKLGNEREYTNAVANQLKICDEMIESQKSIASITGEKLEKSYRFGSSKYSASFLISVGILSSIAAGWFFSIIATTNGLENQNWLYFILTNGFNYLSVYVQENGQMYAARYMGMSSVIVIGSITLVVWISEVFLSRMTSDRGESFFGVDINQKDEIEKGFKRRFNVKLRAKSTSALWFQLLPWIAIFTVIMIGVAVGLGESSDQSVKLLGQYLSSQVIGSTISLMLTGLYFIYMIKIMEPKQEKLGDSEKPKKVNFELIILIILSNAFLIWLIINSGIGNSEDTGKNFISVAGFMCTVNLTAFTLGFGIRQSGLHKTHEMATKKMTVLSNYRRALSGNKPIQMWIREEQQFSKHFLSLRSDLFLLMRAKTERLNGLKDRKSPPVFNQDDTNANWFKRKWFIFKKASRSQINRFYRLNFPELSVTLEELRNSLNAKKRQLEEVEMRIREIREGRSDYHLRQLQEIRELEDKRNLFRYQLDSFEEELKHLPLTMDLKRVNMEKDVREGYELGTWMKNSQLTAIQN